MSVLKELFDKGKCLVGLHQGEWSFEAPSRCTEARVCTICGTTEQRTTHAWGEFGWRVEGSCEQVRSCRRCREEEARTQHRWGNWAYDEAHRAPIRTCGRCGMRVSRFPRQAIAPEAPDTEPASTVDPRIIAFATLFAGDDRAARRAQAQEWLAVQLLGSNRALIEDAFVDGDLDSRLSAACVFAEPYARGVDPSLGDAIAQAVCVLSDTAFDRTSSSNYLFTMASAVRVRLIGFQAQGLHEDVVRIGPGAAAWLEERRHLDFKATLLLFSVESLLQLEQIEQADQTLTIVEALTIPDSQSAERRRRDDLRRKLNAMAHRSATELAPETTDPKAAFQTNYADLQNMVAGVREMNTSMFGENSPFNEIVDTLTADVQGPATTQADWLQKSQGARDALTEFLSGGTGEMNALRNRNRAINAAQIFSDPVKGRDPAAIKASLAILIEAREWARTHDSPDDESFALWTMYLCYSRTECEPQAIDALQALRVNLEARRRRITDPMERAGVFLDYPYLFASLCRLLCRAGRGAELLDAMEGSKGRVLADVLTAQRGEAVPDAAFVRPLEQLTPLLAASNAHYLSYFVDDDESYAVLVAKDGSTHCHTIALGKGQLRQLAASVAPNRWQKPRAGYFGTPTVVPERLAPLVDWLAPLVDGGTLSEGDHLCYCPDEHLHLVPLHYVRFRGQPLVRFGTVSRIHSVSAITALLSGPAERPSQFVAAQVPAQQDLGDPDKVSTLARAGTWLAAHSSGTTLSRQHATTDALSALDLTNRVVHFATHGIFPTDHVEGRSPNPFTSSGLALASKGALPSLLALTSGDTADGLLTPQQVLALKVAGSHVTLQACVTGLAKEGIGGDALGLDLAFLLAGARSLLTTHWDVSAHASADFSVLFYGKWLEDGCTRAEAWRSAVLQLMDAPASEGLPSEYYWAAFSLSGDWR